MNQNQFYCLRCRKRVTINATKSASRKDGYQTYCKKCDNEISRKNRMLRKLKQTDKNIY